MINRRGYEVISEEEYYNDIMDTMKTKFPTMSENPGNLLCVFARMIARNENARDYDRVEAFSNAYVATATGMALSKAVRTAGISRISGTRAVGKVTIYKDPRFPQVIIPKNMRILSSSLEYECTNETAIILNKDEMELQVASVEVGSQYNIRAGSKFNPVLNILGVKSIVSKTDLFGGSDLETDLDLRERYFHRMNSNSNSSLKGVMDAVSATRDVYLVDGDENVENVAVGGLEPHSLIIYAEGGTDKDIAESIMKTKPAGVKTNGDISVGVEVGSRTHTVKFSRFKKRIVYYDVEVAIDRAIAPPDFSDRIKEIIVDYTKNNKRIVSYEITNHISQKLESVRGIKTMFFGTEPNPTTNVDLIAPVGLNFNTDIDKIKVVVI